MGFLRKFFMSAPKPLTLAVVDAMSPALQALVWGDLSLRERLQGHGVNLTPVHFYSTIPSVAEIKSSYEYQTAAAAPYHDPTIFQPDTLSSTLDQLMPFASEFNPPRDGDEKTGTSFFWKNSQFSGSDAMAYYCFIRLLRPRTVVEIGSGFSTLVALEAVRRNGSGRVICVEPYPRPFLADNNQITLIRKPAQTLSADELNGWLGDGDFLFIDSTHTVKTGSDCTHLYLRILPRLRRNLLIHAHDIFLPFGLPVDWLLNKQIFWTEQYLLLALLLDNPKARVLFGSSYHQAFQKPRMDQFMGGKWPLGGGSFWFRYDGAGTPA
jgi:hypothetical protein